ncbi:MAG TPA: helix-turn-helix domain-containing protein [Panacibacter sp.]|nr:helix-turn-helix domain-containing protein [Panacibacter sp.]
MKTEAVPILSLFEKEKRFFDDSVEWKPRFPTLHQQFHINRLEDFIEHLKFPFPPHRQTVSDFIFISNGTSTRSKGLDKYDFSANTFFFLPAYQISAHDLMSKDVQGFYCHFDMEIFNRKFIKQDVFADFSFLEFTGSPLVTIDDTTKTHVLNILTRLEFEYNNNTKINSDIISINLLALFLEVRQFAKQEKITENAAFRITQQYKSKLARYIYEKNSVTEYAGMLNVSPNHLNKCVKAATGKSAQDLLSEMVLLEAKVLLKQSTLTVNEIAWKIGKEDPSDFIRFFKSKTSLTPTEYRKRD